MIKNSINVNRVFPSERYDDLYYETMGPGNFQHFVENNGKRVIQGRLDQLALVKLHPGMRVLDLGCGRGELVMFCGSRGIDSYGVDYSEDGLCIGQKCLDFYSPFELKRIHILRSCVTQLPFKKSYFDRLMSWAVLEHLYQWQLEKCLDEIHRVLKPDGVVVLETHPNHWFERMGYRIVKPFKEFFMQKKLPKYDQRHRSEEQGGHVNLKSPVSLKRDMQKQGFTCKIFLLKRDEFQINQGIAQVLGRFLENIPLLSKIFRIRIVAIAAKSKRALETFLDAPADQRWME
jgi:ubiquinone/menaquinone biosynthesis C-methylase UbiE